jgi:Ca2+-binding EF-hand superfamily protein
MGTAREWAGPRYSMWITVLDLNKDGVIDQKDVSLMLARLNTKAAPNDPMDLNQDGKITEADVRLLTQPMHLSATARWPAGKPKM